MQFYFPPAHPIWVFPVSAVLASHLASARREIHYHGKTAEVLTALMPKLGTVDGMERVGLLWQILATAAQAPAAECEHLFSQTFSLTSQSGQQNAMRAAMRFLLAQYPEEIRMVQLLEVTRMSKPTFSRRFKKHAGKTLGKFLQQIRVEAASRELAETEKPGIEIALASGFSQISFFNRVFQRAMKCTPSSYREQIHRQSRPTVAG